MIWRPIRQFPCHAIQLYYALNNPTITHINIGDIWHIAKQYLIQLTNTQLIVALVIPLLPKYMTSMFLFQFALIIPITLPIIFSAKCYELYSGICFIFISIRLWIDGRLPSELIWLEPIYNYTYLEQLILGAGFWPSEGICIPCPRFHCQLHKNQKYATKVEWERPTLPASC